MEILVWLSLMLMVFVLGFRVGWERCKNSVRKGLREFEARTGMKIDMKEEP